MTDLKLRFSWGKSGFYGNTDPLNQYTLYGRTASDAYYDIQGISSGNIRQGFRTVRVGNAKTGWQEDLVTNLGFDAICWNGKFSITLDWYDKSSNGLLFPVSLPDFIRGDAEVPNANIGNIQNKGIDIAVGSTGRFSRNWGWNLSILYSHYDNKIVHLNDFPYIDANEGLVRNQVGFPIGSFYGYQVVGLFKNQKDVLNSATQEGAAPGRFKYRDTYGFGQIKDNDRVHFGNPNPQFTLGINIGITYKHFDFSTFLYGSFGNDVYNQVGAGMDFGGSATHSERALTDSWTPYHTNAKVPILEVTSGFSTFGTINSYPMEKGSYLRNKSLIIGYSFPSGPLEKIKVKRLRYYVQAVNLFTITKYSGLDPEAYSHAVFHPAAPADNPSSFGIDYGNYPNNQIQVYGGLSLGL